MIITDHLGKQVLLANTLWTPVATGTCAAGSELHVTFEFDNVLAAGDFVVCAEIADAVSGEMLHSRREALRFTVTAPIETGGVVDLPMEITVSQAVATQ
jgi:hypothetical protein